MYIPAPQPMAAAPASMIIRNIKRSWFAENLERSFASRWLGFPYLRILMDRKSPPRMQGREVSRKLFLLPAIATILMSIRISDESVIKLMLVAQYHRRLSLARRAQRAYYPCCLIAQ